MERVRRKSRERVKRSNTKTAYLEGIAKKGKDRERLQGRIRDKKPKLAPLVPHVVTRAKIKNPVNVGKVPGGRLFYSVRTQDNTYNRQTRWYYMGCVHVCAMMIEKEPNMYGQYRVHISSWAGNNGNRFKTEDQAHEFIIGELIRDPR